MQYFSVGVSFSMVYVKMIVESFLYLLQTTIYKLIQLHLHMPPPPTAPPVECTWLHEPIANSLRTRCRPNLMSIQTITILMNSR